jgi:hypothetical protein
MIEEADLELTPTTIDLEPVSLVGPDGQPTAEARYTRELPVETLCWLYEMMVVTRDLDSEFVNLQRQGLPLPGTAGGGRGSLKAQLPDVSNPVGPWDTATTRTVGHTITGTSTTSNAGLTYDPATGTYLGPDGH